MEKRNFYVLEHHINSPILDATHLKKKSALFHSMICHFCGYILAHLAQVMKCLRFILIIRKIILGYWRDLVYIKPALKNRFTLINVVGNCATTLKNNVPSIDSSLYKSCFCCGDAYNPDPSLNCPASPWN